MVRLGLILESGKAGPAAELLIAGGFSHIRLDQPGGRAVFGNRVGGFSVSCPGCDRGLGKELSESISGWRRGEAVHVTCPGCGEGRPLSEVETRPGIALGCFALEWRDVQSPDLTELGKQRVRELLGGEYRLVLSRG